MRPALALDNAAASSPVLDVRDLRTVFTTRTGNVHAVNGVSFRLSPGEVLALVGESGSGKSVAMMSILGLLPSKGARVEAGSALFGGRDLTKVGQKALRDVRGRQIGVVFQDPMTTLNPVYSVGFQIAEPLRRHLRLDRKRARTRTVELLRLVGIPSPESRIDDFPHQFSGGMRQRVVIALALACDPQVLIADEPTTALDVTVQAQILDLVRRLQRDMGMAIVWITHDLGVAASIADRVAVMYGGRIVEEAPVEELFSDPCHPYTRALLDALPGRHRVGEQLRSIRGQPIVLTAPPRSCSFASRCNFAVERCRGEVPPLADLGRSARHGVACWRAGDEAVAHGG